MNIEIILPCSFVKPHFGPILSSSTRNLGIFGNGVTLLCYVDCFEADKDEKSRQTKVSWKVRAHWEAGTRVFQAEQAG